MFNPMLRGTFPIIHRAIAISSCNHYIPTDEPEIDTSIAEMPAEDTVELTCRVVANPSPAFVFWYGGGKMIEDGGVSLSREDSEIDKVLISTLRYVEDLCMYV